MSLTLKKTVMWMIKSISDKKNMWFIDAILVLISYMMVEVIVFSSKRIFDVLCMADWYIVCAVCVHLISLIVSNNYRVIWQHASFRNYIRTVVACVSSGIVMMIVSHYFEVSYFYIKSAFLAMIITMFFILSYRAAIKLFHTIMKQYFMVKESGNDIRVLVVGAGSAGTMFVDYTKVNAESNYHIVGFVDDNRSKYMSSIGDVKVLGNRNDIPELCRKHQVEEILIAIPTLDNASRKEILDICTQTDCDIKIMPTLEGFTRNSVLPEIRTVNIEDLLARDEIKLDDDGISDIISGKTILVTGGGGSIGSEICRQLMKFTPSLLVIMDIYENNAYDLENELRSDYPGQDIDVVIASVRDTERLSCIFEQYRPEIVFHAAAHKHVPLMEHSPGEAVKNNVFGTYNVAKCADEYNAEKFVLISTDKAVNPTNVMGATKRMCEMIVQAMQAVSDTQFVAVRFGNVLGSNGSVIPLFKKQIENGGPVTVTHKDITRFFMTIPEAAQLVIQASCFADGGEIFVLDMGQPVKIYDLAKNLIRLSGFVPDKDIKIEVTGLRPGEKLYEELLMNEEGLEKTRHSKIYIGKPLGIQMDEVVSKMDKLRGAIESNDNEKIRMTLAEVVPTYTPDNKSSGQILNCK